MDWASIRKHVAAVLYGVGARLDQAPELLFALRQVDHTALVATAGHDLSLGSAVPGADKVLEDTGLAEMFGIELAVPAEVPSPAVVKPKTTKRVVADDTKGKAKKSRAEVRCDQGIETQAPHFDNERAL